MKEVVGRLSKYEDLDMTVRFGCAEGSFDCRLVVYPYPREDRPRYQKRCGSKSGAIIARWHEFSGFRRCLPERAHWNRWSSPIRAIHFAIMFG